QGSVVDDLVRLVNVPVLTLRPPDDIEHHPPPDHLSRLLVPLDGSETAAHALAPAARLTHRTGAPSRRLHVITGSAQARADSRPAGDEVGDPSSDTLAAEGERLLESAAAPLRSEGLTVHTSVRVASDPAACILDEAEQHDVDCIAIATHGRGGLTRMLFGSVADRVFRGAAQAVLLLRAEPAERQVVQARAPELRGA